MSHWLVTQDNTQFTVEDLDELVKLAATGKLGSGDMVQPPGATDWIYASEIPEISRLLGDGGDTLEEDTDDLEWRRRGFGGFAAMGTAAAAMLLLGVLVVGTLTAVFFYGRMPTGAESLIGEDGLSYSQMLVTEKGAPVYQKPNAQSATLANLPKDQVLDLLAKRGDFYKVRTAADDVGWIAIDHVLPMYLLGGGVVMSEYDPLYNPDRYIVVRNATWLQIDQENTQLTVFRFLLENNSRYPMTDLVLLATIKDSRGNELEKVEIPVEGIIPASDVTMVGTLAEEGDEPELESDRSLTEYTFYQLAAVDPDLQLHYSDGIEVEMRTVDFTEAEIDLLEVRAIPTDAG
ncbi:MAG: hypothetical protein JRJ84_20270 [Deltaproteobacteria bacterium]|nr:hypothetical protein [Deltaproteobacteria bacterium]